MRKIYCKPRIEIEKFELSQHIATCEHIMVTNQAIREGCDADNPQDKDQSEAKNYFWYQEKPGIPLARYTPSAPQSIPDNLFYKDIAGTRCQVDGENMYCHTNGGSDTFLFTS